MPAFPLVVVVSPLSSIVKGQAGYLRKLGFEVAFIGESEKLDKDIVKGNIKAQFLYGRPESIEGDIKFKEMFHSCITGEMLLLLFVMKFILLFTGKKLL